MAIIGYVEEADFTAYADARGVTLEQAESVLLTLALDWIELQPYSGEKTDPAQALQFPRNSETEIPDQIKTAQMACALVYNAGGDPLNTEGVTPQVVSESVPGAVSVTYSDKGGTSSVSYPVLDSLIAPYLEPAGYGNQISVVPA